MTSYALSKAARLSIETVITGVAIRLAMTSYRMFIANTLDRRPVKIAPSGGK